MKIFVTGALGFIGSHFVERALAGGHRVLGLFRSSSGEKQALLSSLTRQGAHLVQGDVLAPEAYREALQGTDCVCHFAAAFKGATYSEADFHRVNVGGTEALLAAAAAAHVRRFILCSTAGIYGQQLAGITNESAPTEPWNAYERSKLLAEESVRTLAPARGMQFVILRPSVVYGPRDDRLGKLFRSAARGQFPLFGKGHGRRHMVYVTDVADAFLLACHQPTARDEAMIIAGPDVVSLRELLDTLAAVMQRRSFGPKLPLAPMLLAAALVEDLCAVLGITPPIYRRRMDFYRSDAAFDCTRARQLLGWQPTVHLREGLQRTHESMQARQVTNAWESLRPAP